MSFVSWCPLVKVCIPWLNCPLCLGVCIHHLVSASASRVFNDIMKTAWSVSDVLALALIVISFYAAMTNLLFEDFDVIPEIVRTSI